MSKSLRMSMESVAFQTALDYSNTTPDLVTLTRHFGQQKKQDAGPGETAKAHGAELGEHSEQRGKKTDHDDSHGSNGTTPGAGAGAGSRVGVTLFRTLLLQPLLLLFAHLDLAMLWCVLDGLKRSLEREREKSKSSLRNRIFVALEALKTSTTTRTLMVPSLSALVVFATPSEEPLRRSALMYFIRSAAINPATSASTVVVAAAVAAAATDSDACCDGSLLVAPPSSPVKTIHGQKGERKRSERLSDGTMGADRGS